MRRRYPRASKLTLLLTVMVLLAGGCGRAGRTGGLPRKDGDSDVLVVGSLEVPGHLDPARVYEKFASDVLFNTTNRLVEFKPGTTELGPGLAESWDVSPDARTYTFRLRRGVRFHDGSEMTAEDVAFSIERALRINHPDGAAFLLAGITSIATPDPYTVVVTLDQANVTFLPRLNYTVASILPSDGAAYRAPAQRLGPPGKPAGAVEANAFLNDQTVIGTGPYRLTEYKPGESLQLERFDGYWGPAPAVKTVKVRFFQTTAQMKNALQAGEIDLNNNEFGPSERDALSRDPAITVDPGPGARIRYLVLNPSRPPFDQPAVRRAVAAAVNRRRIVDEVFEGGGKPLLSMIPSGFPASRDYVSSLPDRVDGPVEFTLWYPLNKYGETEPDLAQTIARSLNETGRFRVTTSGADWASEFSDNLRAGVYPAYLLGWYPDYIDPDDYVSPFYQSTAPPYAVGYHNPSMDALIRQEQRETDTARRRQIFAEIQKIAAEDMPYVPLLEQGPFVYYRRGVGGIHQTLDATQQFRFFVLNKQR